MRTGARGDKLRTTAPATDPGARSVRRDLPPYGASLAAVPHSPHDMPATPVPDLGTLRSICQGEKVRQDRRPWYVLSRRVSIVITWWLLHTPVTANQVTLASLVLALAAGVLLAMPSKALALAAAGMLVVHYFLDKVDGEIARFRKVHSLTGVYMDELSHVFAYAGTFAGLGVHLAWRARTPAETLEVLEAATGSARFLGIVLRGQALLQAAVLVALIWINLSFNLETEVRRLNDLSQERYRDTHAE